VLGPAEARVMGVAASLLLLLSIVAVKWPHFVTFPLAFFGTWIAVVLIMRAYKLHKGVGENGDEEKGKPPPLPAPSRDAR
jgi:hypothetical protein